MNDKNTINQPDTDIDVVSNVNLAPKETGASGVSTSLKSYPLLGWLFAGGDMIPARLEDVASIINQKLDETNQTIQSMQAKGMEIEQELKRVLDPFTVLENTQSLLSSFSVFRLLSGGKKRQVREQQIDNLNTKVDLLVEQVALLAAKEAAAKTKSETIGKPKRQNDKQQESDTENTAKDTSTSTSAVDEKTVPTTAPKRRGRPPTKNATKTSVNRTKPKAVDKVASKSNAEIPDDNVDNSGNE